MKVHHCRPAVFPASPPQVFSALLKHFGSGCRPLSCDDTSPPDQCRVRFRRLQRFVCSAARSLSPLEPPLSELDLLA